MGTVSQVVLLLALVMPAFNAAAAPMCENSLAALEDIWEGGVPLIDGPAAITEFSGRLETGQAWAGLAALLGLDSDAPRSLQTGKQTSRRDGLSVKGLAKSLKSAQFKLPAPRPGTTTLSRSRLAEGVYRLFAAFGVVFALLLAAAWRS